MASPEVFAVLLNYLFSPIVKKKNKKSKFVLLQSLYLQNICFYDLFMHFCNSHFLKYSCFVLQSFYFYTFDIVIYNVKMCLLYHQNILMLLIGFDVLHILNKICVPTIVHIELYMVCKKLHRKLLLCNFCIFFLD